MNVVLVGPQFALVRPAFGLVARRFTPWLFLYSALTMAFDGLGLPASPFEVNRREPAKGGPQRHLKVRGAANVARPSLHQSGRLPVPYCGV
jgi:hypothetical protein